MVENQSNPASQQSRGPSTQLQIDTRSAYADSIGREGIARAEVDAMAADLQRAHELMTQRRRGGLDAEYACLNLHETSTESIAAIEAEAERLSKFSDTIVIGI